MAKPEKLLTRASIDKRAEHFIKRARAIHGNKYDYSMVDYKNCYTKVLIGCPFHGTFEAYPQHIVKGAQCPLCARESANAKKQLSTQEFIMKSNEVHKGRYDYSKVDYKGRRYKVIIICTKHGEFLQTAGDHLRGAGCPVCGQEASEKSKYLTTTQFVTKAKHVHGDKYRYDLVHYERTTKPVIIICPIHGEFEQKPWAHLRGQGCPQCAITVGQGEVVDYVKRFGEVVINDRKMIKPLELDIWIPKCCVAIEYHGEYWHSNEYNKNKHAEKFLRCRDKDIHLIQLLSYEWHTRRKQAEALIERHCGCSTEINADNWRMVDKAIAIDFVNQHSLCNVRFRYTSHCIGIYYKTNMVGVVMLNVRKSDTRIIVIAEKNGYIIRNYAAVLKDIFNHCGDNIKYKVDMMKGIGEHISRVFNFVKYEPHSYRYVKVGGRAHNMIFHSKNISKFKFKYYDPNISIAENMFRNGYRRLWDAGYYLYEWRK